MPEATKRTQSIGDPNHEGRAELSLKLPTDSSFGHMMRDTNRLVQARLGVALAPHGITVAQWYVLRVLWDEDGLSQAAVAARAGISNPSVGAAFQTLLRGGLIRCFQDANDRRKNVVVLTDLGRRLEETCLRHAMETNDAALEGLSEQDIATTLRVLHRARANLKRLEANYGARRFLPEAP